MDNAELQLILENSFTPAKLRSLLPEWESQEYLYEEAVDSILRGDEAGERISEELDQLSARQREKIGSMAISQIRQAFSPEFIEPGKTLAAILWALMRDERIGVRNLVHSLAETFLTESDEAEDFDLDDFEVEDFDSFSGESPEELEEEFTVEEYGEENDPFIIEDEIPEVDIQEEEEIDVEGLLEELSRESEPEEEPDFSDLDAMLEADEEPLSDSLEIPADFQIDYDMVKSDPLPLAEEEDGTEEAIEEDIEPPVDEEVFGHPVTEDQFQQIEEILDLRHDEEGEPYLELADDEEDSKTQKNENLVALGGVYIALDSLKRACEKVFEEPVELVTDDNLTADDKIVVVGKQCGVKVLYGPHYAIQLPQKPKTDDAAPISVSPVSMQAALSRIFGESVELIPDPYLLNQGIIPFAGKHAGIEVLQNDRIQVPMPAWVDQDLSQRMRGEEVPEADESHLKQHIEALEDRLAALESRDWTAAPVVPEPEAAPVPELEPTPESEGEIAEESLSLDEIESEELEPISEEMPDEDESEEDDFLDELVLPEEDQEEISDEEIDIDGLFADEEEETEVEGIDEELLDELKDVEDGDEDDLDLSDLDLDSISGELSDLGDLDLDEEDESQEDAEDTDTGSAGEEIDTDDLDFGKEEINLDDLDLDLEGLDLGEDDLFEPKEVLNGETVMLLGGDAKYGEDYSRIIRELGGNGVWYENLDEMNEEDINELVESADVIMTLTAEAVSDPGILQVTNAAQENNKRLFNHHSATPSSIQKQLMKLVEDGQV